jgi:hypothetical protein
MRIEGNRREEIRLHWDDLLSCRSLEQTRVKRHPLFWLTHSCLLLFLLAMVACASNERDWKEACKVNSRDSYQAFLRKHPSGEYSVDGLRRVEEFDWSSAQKTDDAQAYETYLQQYPKGNHLSQAEARLDVVRPAQGILGIALPQSAGLGPSGDIELGSPIFTLSTTGETLLLRLASDTAYIGIPEERDGVHKWFPGGKYEVIGKQEQLHSASEAECGPAGICMLLGSKNGWATGSWSASGTMGPARILGMSTGLARTGPNVLRRDVFLKSIRYVEGGEGPMSLPDPD